MKPVFISILIQIQHTVSSQFYNFSVQHFFDSCIISGKQLSTTQNNHFTYDIIKTYPFFGLFSNPCTQFPLKNKNRKITELMNQVRG